MTFSTDAGIKEGCGEHVLVHECYMQELNNGRAHVSTTKDGTNEEVMPPLPKLIKQVVETQDKENLQQGEAGISTHCMQYYYKEENKKGSKRNLDLLEENIAEAKVKAIA